MKRPFVVAVSLTLALPAVAQERDPVQRQILLELSGVIGQSHAVRQVCYGPDDAFWRDRMLSMLDAEDADFEFSQRLRGAFNAGFLDAKQRYPACNRLAQEAERGLSSQGQALARRLASPAPAAAPKP